MLSQSAGLVEHKAISPLLPVLLRELLEKNMLACRGEDDLVSSQLLLQSHQNVILQMQTRGMTGLSGPPGKAQGNASVGQPNHQYFCRRLVENTVEFRERFVNDVFDAFYVFLEADF